MIDLLIKKMKYDAYYLVLVASILALLGAYSAELVLDLNSCILCLYQRLDYFLIVVVSMLGTFLLSARKPLTFILIMLLLAEVSLAAYHVSIEHYLIEESYVCNNKAEMLTEIQDWLKRWLTFREVVGNCSQVRFKFMNFSMAEWNLLYSIILTYCFIRRRK